MRPRLALAVVMLSSCILPRVDFDASLEAVGGSSQTGGGGAGGNTAGGGMDATAGTIAIGGNPATGGTSAVGGMHTTGGTDAAGGASAGTGGATTGHVCEAAVGDTTALSIDNFESGTLSLPHAGGRYGFWSAFSDLSAGCSVTGPQSITLVSPGHASAFAAALNGTGCTVWGAATNVTLNASSDGTFCTYDVSVYDGVTFYARSDNSTSTRLSLEQMDIQETRFGGTCALGAAQCNDFFATVIALTPTWTPFTVKFKDLKQGGYGAKFTFAPDKVFGIEFETDFPSPTATTKFQIAVDDLSFTLPSSGGAGGSSGASSTAGTGGSN